MYKKLMNEAISDLRVDYRWKAIDQENQEIALAKEVGRKFIPHTFENGDTLRQLLARSRHIVMKHFSKWTDSQKRRAEILFREYPAIEEAYSVSMKLTQIFNTRCEKNVALTKLSQWYDEVERLNCKFFNSVIQTMQNNYGTIANYFENRSTNASAESFNAKVKAFRNQFRGVSDIPFFLFRLKTIFAKTTEFPWFLTYRGSIKIEHFNIADNFLLSFVKEELFVVLEIFFATVTADEICAVIVDRHFGDENQNFLALRKNFLTEFEGVGKLFARLVGFLFQILFELFKFRFDNLKEFCGVFGCLRKQDRT